MGFSERIRAGRAFERARFKQFCVDGAAIGFVRHDLAEHLRAFDDVFAVGETTVTFVPQVGGCEERSAAIARVADALAAQGLLSPWRNETYDIGWIAERACLFRLERAAVRFFGFMAHAVHVNGLVQNASGKRSMWIARRSDDKAIDPGMLDNLVGGGLASGLTIAQTVIKEAWEEAGIPIEIAATARYEGTVQIVREVREGLHVETIHLHDLGLAAEFVPSNQDGEVAEVRLLPLEQVAVELAGDAPYTVDAALVAIDCLARHGAAEAQWSAAIRARFFQ